MTSAIPRNLFQTFPTRALPVVLDENRQQLVAMHRGWTVELFDDQDCESFIGDEYGRNMRDLYLRIDPRYGAARADFFRYLLMYCRGGVYLDIKSATQRPLDQALSMQEGFVLSKWRNGPGEPYAGSGLQPELAAYPRGEFEQWFIACAPAHPFLAAVIDKVSANIRNYTPWRGGVGRTGVLTGPIPYTLAIEPIRGLHPHIEIISHDVIGLRYSCVGSVDHRPFFRTHYTLLDAPIVRPEPLQVVTNYVYISARRLKHHLFRRNEAL